MDMPTFDEFFKISTVMMRLLGINGTKIHFRYYVIFIYYVPVVILEAGYFATKASSENFVTLAGLVPCISYCIISIIKIQAIVLNRSKVVKLTQSVKELHQRILESPKKIESVRDEVVLVQKLTKYLLILNVTLASVYNYSSLILMSYHYIKTNTMVFDLPFPIIVPFSTDAWIPWFFVYIYSISCAYLCIVYTLALDAMYFVSVTILCVNYTILCDEFQTLETNNFRNIHECIRKHQYLIKLSEDLNDIFELPNFFNVFFGAIQICVLVFCLTAGEWANVPGYLIFLSTVGAQIWTISIFGENLISRSTKINEALINSGWYNTDVKTMKTILFILARSQKPQRLTAYIFSTICMGSFRKIISNSWSYFSLLRTAYKPPE